MEVNINIEATEKKKEPIDKAICFPVTESMKALVAKVRGEKKYNINNDFRAFLEQYLEHVTK